MKVERIVEICKDLRLKTIPERLMDFANNDAGWEDRSEQYLCYLSNLLEFEYQYRKEIRTLRLIKEARFPIIKALESFDFNQAPHLPEDKIRGLANGNHVSKAEPIIFLGESGTGKTHLATAIGYHNAQLGYSVRFVSASHLANELIESRGDHTLTKTIDYYNKFNVLVIDELGYLPLSKTDAELMFQILSKRHEQKPVIITTNLPFSEWTNVFPDRRLCRAVVDRVTHRAHIIETGVRSARLKETLTKMGKEVKSKENIEA